MQSMSQSQVHSLSLVRAVLHGFVYILIIGIVLAIASTILFSAGEHPLFIFYIPVVALVLSDDSERGVCFYRWPV
jgi:hypothetical protein